MFFGRLVDYFLLLILEVFVKRINSEISRINIRFKSVYFKIYHLTIT